MSRRFAVNSSPLILLGRISRLDLLPALAERVVIPEAVLQELTAKQGQDWLAQIVSMHPGLNVVAAAGQSRALVAVVRKLAALDVAELGDDRVRSAMTAHDGAVELSDREGLSRLGHVSSMVAKQVCFVQDATRPLNLPYSLPPPKASGARFPGDRA